MVKRLTISKTLLATAPGLVIITFISFSLIQITLNPQFLNPYWLVLALNLALCYLFIRGLAIVIQSSLDKLSDYHFSLRGISGRLIISFLIAAFLLFGPLDLALDFVERASIDPLISAVLEDQVGEKQLLVASFFVALIAWPISAALIYLYADRHPIVRGPQETVVYSSAEVEPEISEPEEEVIDLSDRIGR